MTEYLLSVYHGDEAGLSPEDLLTSEEMQQSIQDCNALNDRLRAAGAWVFAARPAPVEQRNRSSWVGRRGNHD